MDTKKQIKLNPELDKVKLILGLSSELTDIYQSTIAILEEGIKAGKSNIPLGMMSFIAYIDLLHGGAYKDPVSHLPYYTKDPNRKGPEIEIPIWAKPEQVEALVNSDMRHIFPKLLSDQAYFLLKEWASTVMTVDVLTKVNTGLTTLVESSGKSYRNVGAGTSEMMESGLPILKMLAGIV